eukprot:366565-Chlamydomonas_euryale.AAC.6
MKSSYFEATASAMPKSTTKSSGESASNAKSSAYISATEDEAARAEASARATVADAKAKYAAAAASRMLEARALNQFKLALRAVRSERPYFLPPLRLWERRTQPPAPRCGPADLGGGAGGSRGGAGGAGESAWAPEHSPIFAQRIRAGAANGGAAGGLGGGGSSGSSTARASRSAAANLFDTEDVRSAQMVRSAACTGWLHFAAGTVGCSQLLARAAHIRLLARAAHIFLLALAAHIGLPA